MNAYVTGGVPIRGLVGFNFLTPRHEAIAMVSTKYPSILQPFSL